MRNALVFYIQRGSDVVVNCAMYLERATEQYVDGVFLSNVCVPYGKAMVARDKPVAGDVLHVKILGVDDAGLADVTTESMWQAETLLDDRDTGHHEFLDLMDDLAGEVIEEYREAMARPRKRGGAQ